MDGILAISDAILDLMESAKYPKKQVIDNEEIALRYIELKQLQAVKPLDTGFMIRHSGGLASLCLGYDAKFATPMIDNVRNVDLVKLGKRYVEINEIADYDGVEYNRQMDLFDKQYDDGFFNILGKEQIDQRHLIVLFVLAIQTKQIPRSFIQYLSHQHLELFNLVWLFSRTGSWLTYEVVRWI